MFNNDTHMLEKINVAKHVSLDGQEAHAHHLPVVAHAHRLEEIRRGLKYNVDCFEHTGLARYRSIAPCQIVGKRLPGIAFANAGLGRSANVRECDSRHVAVTQMSAYNDGFPTCESHLIRQTAAKAQCTQGIAG